MMIFYARDGEGPAIMELDSLIWNFTLSNTWEDSDFTEPDLRSELDDRGWFENVHDNGRFLVLNLDRCKAMLTPTPEAWLHFYTNGTTAGHE